MKRKILITDFDGTLANSDSEISEENLQAIRAFVARGGIFCICTGRMRVGILHVIEKYAIKGLLACFNGAEIINLETGDVIYEKSIPNELTVKTLKEIEKCNAYVQGYYDNKLWIDHRSEITTAYEKISKVTANLTSEKLSAHFERVKKPSNKLFVADLPDVIKNTYIYLLQVLGNQLNIINSNPTQIEITNKAVSKSNAILTIAEYYGLTPNDVVAVGDAGNDCPMLETAGLGIAVKNALEPVKRSADVVLDVTNDEHAIKRIIEEFCI